MSDYYSTGKKSKRKLKQVEVKAAAAIEIARYQAIAAVAKSDELSTSDIRAVLTHLGVVLK